MSGRAQCSGGQLDVIGQMIANMGTFFRGKLANLMAAGTPIIAMRVWLAMEKDTSVEKL